MILIADSGGTKVDWCLLDGAKVVNRIKTPGMNAMMLSPEEMTEIIGRDVRPNIEEPGKVHAVYFYGAGCIGDVINKVHDAIKSSFPNAHIEVASDLLAAARALCGDKAGIACIMGTGSNTCFYDGERIAMNVPALGYILGDEGSGAVLGRTLVSDVFKNQLPEHVCKKFKAQYGLDIPTVVQKVYREPFANKFLASLTPFLLENIKEPSVHALVINSFKMFFSRNIAQYPDYKTLKVNLVGSVAWYFRETLAEAAGEMECTLGRILVSPMEGLIEFHQKN